MKLLSIETATDICSVALHDENQCISNKDLEDGMRHSRELGNLTSLVLESAKIRPQDLDGIVVSKGPGSYTGLRIGVSFAKAMCYSLNIPLIGVNTLEILASAAIENQHSEEGLYCAMIDARRMEVYMAVFDQHLNTKEPTTPVIITPDSLDRWRSKSKLFLFGNGMGKCKPLFNKEKGIFFLDEIKLSARFSGRIGIDRYSRGLFEDLAYFEPFYLKSFQAKPSKKLL